MNYLRYIFLIGCCWPLLAQPSTSTRLEGIVAVVNDGLVLRSELDRQLSEMRDNLNKQRIPLPPAAALEEQVLEQLILQEIQIQRARQLNIEVEEASIDQMLTRIAERNGLTLTQLPIELARDGIDYDAYRQQIREQLMIEQLRFREVGAAVNVSRSEVETLADRVVGQQSREFNVAHILIAIPIDADDAAIASAKAQAEEIFTHVRSGENFSALAAKFSAAPDAESGGNLGWRRLIELPSVFVDPVQNLTIGDTHPPIRSANGFHIVKLVDVRDIDREQALNEAYRQLQEREIALETDNWLRRLRDEAYIDVRL